MKHAFATVLALLIAGAPASGKSAYGDWQAEDLGDDTEAYTRNESGSVFGLLCGRECVFFVNLARKCEQDHDYPAMINSDAGAYPVELKCIVLDEDYILTFPATNEHADILEAGGTIGFALALEGGDFGVSRFSLKGGLDAASAITRAAEGKTGGRKGMRDFTI